MKNKEQNKFSWQQRLKSFSYAWDGLKVLIREEHNARIHFAISVVVLLSGFIFNISASEWIAVIMSIALVVSIEIINSAIENLCDFVSPQYNLSIKKAKDLAAAAVLVCSISAIIVGILIFLPKIISLFDK